MSMPLAFLVLLFASTPAVRPWNLRIAVDDTTFLWPRGCTAHVDASKALARYGIAVVQEDDPLVDFVARFSFDARRADCDEMVDGVLPGTVELLIADVPFVTAQMTLTQSASPLDESLNYLARALVQRLLENEQLAAYTQALPAGSVKPLSVLVAASALETEEGSAQERFEHALFLELNALIKDVRSLDEIGNTNLPADLDRCLCHACVSETCVVSAAKYLGATHVISGAYAEAFGHAVVLKLIDGRSGSLVWQLERHAPSHRDALANVRSDLAVLLSVLNH
jgi:hypothetical protein